MGGPLRFDVEVGRAGVSLRLAAPIVVGPARVSELGLDLGHLPPPIDLSAGAAALRHRRSRVASLRLELSLAALVAHAEARGLSLALAPDPSASRARLAGRDASEPTWVFPVAAGVDLLLVPLRDGGEGGAGVGDAAALGSLLRRATGWGDALPGAARLEALPGRILREAFATRGHRVPLLGALPAAAWVGASALHLAFGDAARARGGPPDLARRIADIASLIERSAEGSTGALLREASARLARLEAGSVAEAERPTERHGP